MQLTVNTKIMYYRIFVVYLLPTECNEALITIINIGMEKQLSIIFFATATFLTGCGNQNPEFNNGDLLFEVGQGSRMADAIVDATARHEASGFSHVAILERIGDENFVIEATSKGGVRRITLDEYLHEASHDDKGRPLVAVYRLRDGSPAAAAVERAKLHLGRPYDFAFLPDNDAYYCSELVYESYLDDNGEHIFTARPMTFKRRDGSYAPFWIELFDSLRMEIPEGVAGTNPEDMSKESAIEEIHRYF